MLLAPGASSSASSASFPARSQNSSSSCPPPAAFPPVDDHLVQPEVSNYEIIRGRKVMTMGANPPHAEAHTRADFLIMPHVREGYVASSDLLTRVSEGSKFATEVSSRREGLDPRTGARYLEEISFEIVNEQTLRDVTGKAEDLIRRGVRRVFAIFVKESRVGEWCSWQRKMSRRGSSTAPATSMAKRFVCGAMHIMPQRCGLVKIAAGSNYARRK